MDDTIGPVDPKTVRFHDQAQACKDLNDPSQHNGENGTTDSQQPTKDLRTIICHHEETITKRWMGKSKSKRKALLLKAWPEMPQIHRPDVKTWQSLRNGHSLEDEDTIALMWPNLNSEDLSNKEILLLMLHQRARFHPHKFANHDIGILNFGMRNGLIGQIDLPGYFAVLRDRDSPETYGKLYSWDDDADDVQSEPTRGWFTAGDSYWAVLAQSQIYWFLNVICQQILHDMSPEEVYPAQGDHILPPEYPYHLTKTNIEGVEILAIQAYEDQYKAPRSTDLSRIVTFIGTKLAHAEDHLWALREDPNYLVFTAKDRLEHMTEMVADVDGNPGPQRGLSRTKLWARVFERVIKEAIANVDMFNVLFKKACRLNCLIVTQFKEGLLTPKSPPTPELNEALFDIFHNLICSSWELLATADFESSVYSSPLLRDTFYRSDEMSAIGHPLIWPRENIIQDCIRDRLMWIFNNLSTEHNRFDMGVRGLVAELDLFTRQEPKARALMSPFVAGQVSNLGLLCECLYQLEFFQPWISGYRSYYMNHANELNDQWMLDHLQETYLGNAKKELWEKVAKSLKHDSKGEYVFVAEESSTPTEEDIKRRRMVEAHQDRFWTVLLRGLRDVDAVSTHVENLLYRDELQRTASWVEPVKAAKKEKKKKDDNVPVDPVDQLLDEAIAQNKKLAQNGDGEGEGEMKAPPVTIEVNKRALKVFKALLFEGLGSYEVTKGIQWNDFVYALMSVGFKAEKLFGSGWVFTPDMDTMGFGHPTYFEEPYMGGEINYLIVKQYGRRLRRTYGYRREMFKLAASQPKEAQGSDADSKVEAV
ncbi:uncharacterized protein F4807DRAFT_468363 [Annulohypoxylon truncatum]|uniref:uncharacterized protein n=1 Tax=Annulohypoxylon truncatum TaxID=327061 RepID=UPI00200877E6|nr:uncharacterized protein F4807DRAFT_468363 [Annulohypoxylon truncatum]KAI1208699.1 hypothetical protein F4807DRAFT_468363 [Annulohypoxylon truncatum]